MAVKDNLLELEVVYSKLNKALDENISRLNTGATAVENYNKKISVVPSEFQKSLTDIKTKTDAVTVSARKLEQQSIKESNARNALNKQREVTLKQLDREQQKLNASQNLYNKTQQQLNKVQQAYNNLATKKERYNNLTAFEEKRLKTLQAVTERYNTTLKAVDATVGKHTRNVGNYASGFNPISNSINQLTREMPAFTYSVQTGFMALSNNIPIFTDAIGNAVRQNKELIAQGQPVKSVLSQVAGAFLSWQTLMGVGITLLTVYGKEIGEFIAGTESKKKALEEEKKAIEEKQQAEESARQTTARYQTEEISRSKLLLESAKNVSLSYNERIKAVNELKERYPEYLGNLSTEKILAGETADAENRLNQVLMSRGLALAVQDKFNENLQKELELTLQYADANEKALKIRQESFTEANKMTIVRGKDNIQKEKENSEALKQNKIYKEKVLALREERATLLAIYNANVNNIESVKTNNKETRKAVDLKKEEEKTILGAIAWYEKQIKLRKEESEIIKSNSKVQLSQNEAYQTQLKVIADLQKGLDRLLETKKEELKLGNELNSEIYSQDFFDKQISNLESRIKLINKENEAYSSLNEQLQLWKDMRDAMYGTGDAQEKATEKLEDFSSYYKGFVDEFTSQTGFGKMFDLLATDLDKFKGDAVATALVISDAFQEAFNTIANANQRNFDKEYELNELRYTNALKFANGNAEAEEALLKEKERREKEIAIREAKAQKKLAMFNIAINGAQAITATLGKTGFAGIPLAAIVGTLVAAQLALVASQEIPEYWKGTDNAPEGWAKTNERGAEIHTDSKGNIKDLGTNKGTQVKYLQKGDKIINATKTKELLSLSSFNKEYNDMLFRNQILPPIMMNNANNIDLSGVESKLDKLVNKSEVTIVDDENGRRYYEKKNNVTMELKNSRIYLKSRNVRS